MVFGCGYLGGAVARAARARGLRVTALTRNAPQAAALRAEGIATLEADLAHDAWHAPLAAAGPVDLVLNTVSSGGGALENYRRSYVEGMVSIARWAATLPAAPRTFVYTSSTSVYPQEGGVAVDENAPTAGAPPRGALLLEAERVLREGVATAAPGARWFILRLAGLYGPARTHLIEQIRTGEVAGIGTHRLNLIHRDDAVAAIAACFDAPPAVRHEVFNVADDAPAPKLEVAAWLAARLGVPAPRFTGEPVSARRGLTPDRVILNAKLRAVLGWRPRFPSFREGYENILSPRAPGRSLDDQSLTLNT